MSDKSFRTYSLFPKLLSSCVEQLTRPVMKTKGLAGSKVITEWSAIVGDKLAKHAMPEKLAFPKGGKTGGTLTISVQNGFATELQYMQPMILERLAVYFGYQAIARIVISHTWIEAPQKVKSPVKKHTKPRPVEDYHVNTDTIEDAELRAALESFAKSLSEPAS